MPIQQHPIPQNVTQYQFRLVGDMTLKQFLQLAGGIVIALFFYLTGLPFFIKWPMIAISAAAGASMAFLPIEGRPLDQWVVAFFRSIYSPTIYTWQKPGASNKPPLPAVEAPLPPSTTKPATSSTPSSPVSGNVQSPSTPPLSPTPLPTAPVSAPPPAATPVETPTLTESIPTTREARTVFTAPTQAIKIEPIIKSSPQEGFVVAPPSEIQSKPLPGSSTTFSSNLPIPHPPTTPNTITGMTLTPDGKILDAAIVEILQDGQTVRATKSNKLGQFLFVKPLDNGQFQLTAEKAPHTFPVFNLQLEGQSLPPIQLKATA